MNRVLPICLLIALSTSVALAAEEPASSDGKTGEQRDWLKTSLADDMRAAGHFSLRDYSNMRTWVDQAGPEQIDLLVAYYLLSRDVASGRAQYAGRTEFGTIGRRLSYMSGHVPRVKNFIYATQRVYKPSRSMDQSDATVQPGYGYFAYYPSYAYNGYLGGADYSVMASSIGSTRKSSNSTSPYLYLPKGFTRGDNPYRPLNLGINPNPVTPPAATPVSSPESSHKAGRRK